MTPDQIPEASGPPPVRQFVKDGKWCIPVSERPKNWREILPEPKPAKKAVNGA